MNRVSSIFKPGSRRIAGRVGLVLCIVAVLVGVFSYQVSSALAAAPTGQTIWLRANANNQYVSADQNLANVQLVANRASAGGWETFTVVDAGGGLIALRASNGMYVAADSGLATYVPLVANRATIGTWEKFQWIDVSSGQVRLIASTNGRYVAADLNRSAYLVADRTTASTWETFTWGSSTTPPTTPPPTTPPATTPPPTTQPGQAPYGGTRWAVPGTIQAENYDTGGEGVAYHDSETANQGGVYRTDGVDIEATTDTGGGNNVGWTAAGEWLEYSVNVSAAGTYTLSARTASQSGGGSMHMEMDGANKTGTLSIPSTGAWQTWTTVTSASFSLAAGQHVMRIAIDAAGFNLNWVSLTSGGTPPPTTPPPTTPPGSFPARFTAPYQPVWTSPNLATLATATGNKYWTLAFIINGSGTCNPMWNGDTALSNTWNVSGLRSMGGDVIISFGGAAGVEIAASCPDVASTQAAYQKVLTAMGARAIDLDIESGYESDTASIDRRNKAMHNLQVANPGLIVDYTLAVDRSGLPQAQINLLNNAKNNGVTIRSVNIMAMDYGPCYSDMGQAAVDAANATKNQLAANGINAKVGVTPMIGVNDVTCEVFSTNDANVLVNFAQANSFINLLAYWEQGADPNRTYINIFKTFH